MRPAKRTMEKVSIRVDSPFAAARGVQRRGRGNDYARGKDIEVPIDNLFLVADKLGVSTSTKDKQNFCCPPFLIDGNSSPNTRPFIFLRYHQQGGSTRGG